MSRTRATTNTPDGHGTGIFALWRLLPLYPLKSPQGQTPTFDQSRVIISPVASALSLLRGAALWRAPVDSLFAHIPSLSTHRTRFIHATKPFNSTDLNRPQYWVHSTIRKLVN